MIPANSWTRFVRKTVVAGSEHLCQVEQQLCFLLPLCVRPEFRFFDNVPGLNVCRQPEFETAVELVCLAIRQFTMRVGHRVITLQVYIVAAQVPCTSCMDDGVSFVPEFSALHPFQ